MLMSVSSFFGVDPLHSFWGYSIRFTGLFTSYHLALFAFMIQGYLALHPKNGLVHMVTAITVTGFLPALYGILEYLSLVPVLTGGAGARSGSFFYNATHFGSFLVAPALLSLVLIAKTFGWQRLLAALASLTIMLGLLCSGSNGALLGVLLGAMTLLLTFFFPKKTISKKSYLLMMSFGSLAVICLFFLTRSLAPSNSVVHTLTHPFTQSASERIVLWDMALTGWQSHPWIGVGAENFYYIGERFFNDAVYDFYSIWPDKPHNQFLEILTTGGALSMAFYLLIIWFMFRSYCAKPHGSDRLTHLFLIAALTGHLIQSMFLFETISLGISFFLLLGFALPHLTNKQIQPKSCSPKTMILVPLLCAVAVGTLLIFVHRPLSKDLTSIQQALNATSEDWEMVISHLSEVGTHGYIYDPFLLADKGRLLTVSATQHTADRQIISQVVEQALSPYPLLLQRHPERGLYLFYQLRLQSFAAELNGTYSNTQTLRNGLNRLLLLIPQRHETFTLETELIAAYVSQQDEEEANLYMNNLSAHYQKIDRRDYLIGTANFLLARGDLEPLSVILEWMVEEEPDVIQHYISLASTYAQIGKIDQAIATANRLLIVDPSEQENVKAFLSSLGP